MGNNPIFDAYEEDFTNCIIHGLCPVGAGAANEDRF